MTSPADRAGPGAEARRLLGRTRSELEFVRPGALLESLEERLATLQTTCRDVAEAVAMQFFRPTMWVAWSDAGRTSDTGSGA